MLTHLSDEDVDLLGFSAEASHPRNMIAQTLVVPPPCARPAIYSSEGSRSRGQNDLTVRLLEVMRRSHEVAASIPETHTWRSMGAPSADLLEKLARLQYEVFLMVNNGTRVQKPPGMGRSGGSASAKTLLERIKGKEGRVRGNLMGKRVDFSARCVITPDAYFDCDRVGVPERIAVELTFPEVVNAINRDALEARVRRGAHRVDGAHAVLHADGTVTHLASCRDRDGVAVRVGDVVERPLADDDVVVFNRQPSLHMHGMVAHRVRIMPGYTFRIALPVAAPYNADFDGDEMNLHVPQSRAAIAECATLMAVAQANGIGAQANRPVMGIVQDSLLSLHLLTQPEVLVTRRHACRMLGHVRRAAPPPAAGGRRVRADGTTSARWWTGKQLVSEILPAGLYVEPHDDLDPSTAPFDDDAALPVVVRDGALLCGVLRKAHVGTAAGGIVDVLCRDLGGVACLRFMSDAQRLTHEFLLQRGHHVNIEDVMLSAQGHERVTERLQKVSTLCDEIQREVDAGAPADMASKGEAAILRLLSKTLMQTGAIVNEHMSPRSSIRRMVTAGSKGSFLNLSQVCAALGQQSLEGARIVAEKGARTLPCFAHHDTSLAARGMVFNSFALGLSPSELYYHGIGGREGLVDTAVKTSVTGYLQRRMNKSMEDNVVHADGTVRVADGGVVAFRYGSDGLDPAKLERARLALLAEPEARVRARMTEEEAALALACRDDVRAVKTHVLAGEFDARVLLPFHPERVRRRIERHAAGARRPGSRRGRRGRPGGRRRPRRRDAARPPLARECVARGCRAVAAAVLHVLCASSVAGMARDAHAALRDDLEDRVARAAVAPGESVGCLAAQSIGEPATQLTLNSFHTAGVAAKNVTLGIPRLKELLDATRNPKTPCTTLRFRAPYARSEPFASYVADTLALTRLGDIVASCALVDASAPTGDGAWLSSRRRRSRAPRHPRTPRAATRASCSRRR